MTSPPIPPSGGPAGGADGVPPVRAVAGRTAPPAVRPPDRYGDPGPVRRHLRLAVVVALGLVLSAWAVWAGLGLALDRVDAQQQGYQVVDDSSVLVTFSVTKRADEAVVCQVEALSSTSARVGFLEWPVGADAGASSVQTVEVRTQQRAVTGLVKGCAPAQ